MAQIISATAHLANRAQRGGAREHSDRLLGQSKALLGEARSMAAEGRLDQALELSYRAALRTAGARVAASPVSRRRRLPTSGWERLALVSEADRQWSREFAPYSRLSARVLSGLDAVPPAEVVFELMELCARFIDATEVELTLGGAAA